MAFDSSGLSQSRTQTTKHHCCLKSSKRTIQSTSRELVEAVSGVGGGSHRDFGNRGCDAVNLVGVRRVSCDVFWVDSGPWVDGGGLRVVGGGPKSTKMSTFVTAGGFCRQYSI